LGDAWLEAVIRSYRPILAIANDRFGSNPRFVDTPIWSALSTVLEANRPLLDPIIKSVGRIDLANNIEFPAIGTGWIIAADAGGDFVVTSAHAARVFGERSGTGFQFRPGVLDSSIKQSAVIDFGDEAGATSARKFPITDIVWISDVPGLDVAILRVARTAGGDRLGLPIKLLSDEIPEGRMLAVIGFPNGASGYDPEPFTRLFGPIFGKKGLAPGLYTGRRNGGGITYDRSTLPGSSGSVVIDVITGCAVGLHLPERYLTRAMPFRLPTLHGFLEIGRGRPSAEVKAWVMLPPLIGAYQPLTDQLKSCCRSKSP